MYELSFISLLALCMVSFIGVPHGSFDGAVAALLGYKTRKDFFIFVFLYLIISTAVIIFWIYFSVIALILFILMSIVHFGLCVWSYLGLKKYKWSVSVTVLCSFTLFFRLGWIKHPCSSFYLYLSC